MTGWSPDTPNGPVTLVLGGARSGKSVTAERLILAHPGPLVYLATATATDPEMAARIETHRRNRDRRFQTLESGPDLPGALRAAPPHPVLVEALGTWVAGFTDFAPDTAALVAALAARHVPTVIVSDEVGLGVHPSTEIGRHFRDALGLVNQAVAAVATDVWLVIAGRRLRLEP